MKGVGMMKMNHWIVMGAIVIGWLVGAGVAPAAECTALWQFEETSGTPANDTIASIPLAVLGGAELNIGGKFGSGPSGVGFDPDNNNLSRLRTNGGAGTTPTQLIGDFSMLLWIRPTAGDVNNTCYLIDSTDAANLNNASGGYRMPLTDTDGQADGNGLRFQAKVTGGATKTYNHTRDITANVWHLLAVRYDTDGVVSLNVLAETDTVNATFVAANSATGTGGGALDFDFDGTGDGAGLTWLGIQTSLSAAADFEGRMDDLAFFSGLLTDAEIARAFNEGAAALLVPPTQGTLFIIR